MNILHEEYTVARDDYANAGTVSSEIKDTLRKIGIDMKVIRRIAIASYEAEINMIIHAWGGTITLDIDDSNLITLVFHDTGPGIADLEKAMTPGWSTASEKARELGFGAGMGLPNIKRVSDRFDLQSSKEGTVLTICFQVAA